MGRYDVRREVGVIPILGMPFHYGFATNADEADGTVLGHVAKSAITGPVVWKANSPKPARASKRKATGTVSSFIAAPAIDAARKAGWKIGKARFRMGSATTLTKAVYVTIDGIKYAWRIPNTTATNMGNLDALGIKVATAADKDLVFGASSPKPPRAQKAVDGSVISTFYDPSVTLPAGYTVVGTKHDPETTVASGT